MNSELSEQRHAKRQPRTEVLNCLCLDNSIARNRGWVRSDYGESILGPYKDLENITLKSPNFFIALQKCAILVPSERTSFAKTSIYPKPSARRMERCSEHADENRGFVPRCAERRYAQLMRPDTFCLQPVLCL